MRRFTLFRPLVLLPAVVALGIAGAVTAQIAGDRGVAPIDSSGDFEVTDVHVDVSAKNAEDARKGGWRLAQRKAWQMLSQRMTGHAGSLSDSTLNGLVSGIVVENEQIGPGRYIATLGVLFDRGRAGSLLGVGGHTFRSPPMLVIPVQWSGGAAQSLEQRTDWQEAWARFRTGNSNIDYVRPTGTGSDPLLLNLGQTGRRDRGWCRMVLDQFGASDVLIPVAHLYHQYPGGPVIGVFEARFGPDNRRIARFTLRVENADGVPALMDAGVQRIDQAYQNALRGGILRVDPSLAYIPPPEEEQAPDEGLGEDIIEMAPAPVAGASFNVQFDSPSAAAISATEAAMRAVPGVGSAATTSLALGGVSVMQVTFAGDVNSLRAALEARGWQVAVGGTTLRIRRPAAPAAPPPQPAAGGATEG
ncbi:MAG TPA: heavy-metal-associated domain-containing protein [Sphingomonas sp.]|nr:heavy-metal-associated domain-containing protein [Sphingomonas sp.]